MIRNLLAGFALLPLLASPSSLIGASRDGKDPAPVTVSVTNASELDITGCFSSSYSDYVIRFRLFPQAGSADVMAQVGSGSYDTAMDYASALSFTGMAGLVGSGHSGMYDANSSGVGNAGFYLASGARKNPALPVAGTIELIGASVPGIEHYGRAWVTALVGTAPAVYAMNWNYLKGETTAIDRIRFVASSGNITGTATCQPLRQ